MSSTATSSGTLPTASVADTASALTEVLLPVIARGVIVRRPGVVRTIERFDADQRAVRRMQRLDERYGSGPLRLRIPGREMVLVLDPDDVRRVLSGAPEPFAPATDEKRAALSHFQPHGVLASRGAERVERRRFNEAVLGSDLSIHPRAGALVVKAAEEADALVEQVRQRGELRWEDYTVAWHRVIRRVVLGDAARDDHAVTDLLADLRAAGNWAFLRPTPKETRTRFLRQLRGHLERAEPDSLAGVMATTPTDEDTEPLQQVPQWLFAYDAAGWAGIRTLALIASHRDHADRYRDELADADLREPQQLSGLRASVLESLRLYPTTPIILRQATVATPLGRGALPGGTSVTIFAPFFHRDDRRVPFADRFAPEVWEGCTGGRELGDLTEDWPLLPFSGGPAVCPGRNLVLLTTSTFLGVLLQRLDPRLEADHPLHQGEPLPGSLDPFTLAFHLPR